jgi:hypothetical protein
MGEVPIIQYLIDQGADLGAYDLGKKNDGQFGSSIEAAGACRLRHRRWRFRTPTTPSFIMKRR